MEVYAESKGEYPPDNVIILIILNLIYAASEKNNILKGPMLYCFSSISHSYLQLIYRLICT